MAFVLTLLYVIICYLSPGAFGETFASLHIELILAGALILLTLPRMGESRAFHRPGSYYAVGVLASACLSVVSTGWLGGGLPTLLSLLPSVIVYFFVFINCKTLRQQQVMVYALWMVAVFIIIQGSMAQFSNDYMSDYVFPEHLTLRLRGLGIIHDPNDTAQFFLMLVPLLWLRWKKGRLLPNILQCILPAAVLLFGVFQTHSRGGVFALVLTLMFAFKDKLTKIGSVILGAVALVGLVALNVTGGRGLTNDDGARVTLWAMGLETLKQHFIFGVGAGNFGDYTPTHQTAHNSYVLAMVELGLVGYFFWMGLLVSSWTEMSWLIRLQEKLKFGRMSDLRRLEMAATVGDRMSPEVAALAEAPAGAGVSLSAAMVRRASRMKAREVAPSNTWTPFRTMNPLGAMAEDLSEDELAWAAQVVRVSMVSLLVSSLFLSRTYTLSVYLLMGVAAALVNQAKERPPTKVWTEVRNTTLVCAVVLLAVYLFIRLHGGR
jgi:O-antigen ligase